ncbi:hypothetical protein CHS0354_023504 [Potamilus streckersoni]|uniref:Uncharacterized protein n=1 Tax=Potamilus streckersoni TaxID=2493646 RepID=A0AAE0RV64_9BIVA|nr:hypothetical protein CHS0354_023504 [Potamilus streckersoni]
MLKNGINSERDGQYSHYSEKNLDKRNAAQNRLIIGEGNSRNAAQNRERDQDALRRLDIFYGKQKVLQRSRNNRRKHFRPQTQN